MEKVDVVIIGAGVVGLVIASEIARQDREIYILEKEKKHGQRTSSRNSEVVHASIYYPRGSLKAELRQGQHLDLPYMRGGNSPQQDREDNRSDE